MYSAMRKSHKKKRKRRKNSDGKGILKNISFISKCLQRHRMKYETKYENIYYGHQSNSSKTSINYI